MRIAFLTFSLKYGGAERMVSRLANSMVKRGIDVDILLLLNAKEIGYEVDPRVNIIDVSCEGSAGIGRIRSIMCIRQYIKNVNPDAMYCFMISTLPFAVLANMFLGKCKIIGTQRANPKSVKLLYRIIVHPFILLCDGFVFQTNGAKLMYSKTIQKKSVVIGNIAPINSNEKNKTDSSLYDVCSVGRLHEDKDYDTLINAFELVVRDIPEAKLHIYGDGPLQEYYEDMCKNKNIEANIIFEGQKNNIENELLKHEIFVFASKAEGMPNALLEAMAYGLACVSSDCDFGPADLIKDGENGLLVPVGDVQKMAFKIEYLLNNDDERKKIQNEAIKICNLFSEKRVVDEYISYARGL
ncbi:glycosyltransferase [Butyrivibrio fibrisolvens]|uniref:glycosyltransferase n=1 Tax=Pseudobutyrivibrio ruminis TaxID=46206 RepID=UPI0004124FCE|nr:glycosyltransferase [Pseudobutyrivibrio ruminis]MDC7278814.1 glycosyltransferase [Butyrivibrio fibrisolvens]